MQRDSSVVGLDIAKCVFHLVGMDTQGKIVMCARRSRGRCSPCWPTWGLPRLLQGAKFDKVPLDAFPLLRGHHPPFFTDNVCRTRLRPQRLEVTDGPCQRLYPQAVHLQPPGIRHGNPCRHGITGSTSRRSSPPGFFVPCFKRSPCGMEQLPAESLQPAYLSGRLWQVYVPAGSRARVVPSGRADPLALSRGRPSLRPSGLAPRFPWRPHTGALACRPA
jgi:hypothetical protein